MKEIKVSYAKINNMGDLLNELIIERIFGYKVIHSDSFKCQTSGIGSNLSSFFPEKSQSFPKRIVKKIYGALNPPVQIWSTGFIRYTDEEHILVRREYNIASVRGELSKKRLEKILKTNLKVPTGDGGLLASLLIEKPIQKKYTVGIIPHFKEKNEPQFKRLLEKYNKSVLIDLSDDPLEVIKTIGECEFILSSSLHGLIVADSFGIPNMRLVCTNKLLGDGFKFDDYYSSFNIKGTYFDLNRNPDGPTIEDIVNNYKITITEVEKKQKEIYNSFNKYI